MCTCATVLLLPAAAAAPELRLFGPNCCGPVLPATIPVAALELGIFCWGGGGGGVACVACALSAVRRALEGKLLLDGDAAAMAAATAGWLWCVNAVVAAAGGWLWRVNGGFGAAVFGVWGEGAAAVVAVGSVEVRGG